MDVQVTLKSEPRHLHIVCTGHYHLATCNALIQQVREECERTGCYHVLLDLRELLGPMPDFQRFQLGERAAKELPPQCRLGIICRPEEINRFFENVATNRGLKTFVGPDLEVVWEWLWKK